MLGDLLLGSILVGRVSILRLTCLTHMAFVHLNDGPVCQGALRGLITLGPGQKLIGGSGLTGWGGEASSGP